MHPRALLGMARLRARNLSEALKFADQSLDAAPNFTDARQFRALIRARLGDRSAVDDIDRLLQTPTPHILYNTACTLAILMRKDVRFELRQSRLELLRRAIDVGFPRKIAANDPDLACLRDRVEFRALLAAPKN